MVFFRGVVDVDLPATYYWSAFAPELGLSNKGIPLDQARSTLTKFGLDITAEHGLAKAETPIDHNDEEEDAMMLMANDGSLELLVSLDVLQEVNNCGSNNLNESRLCKGLLFSESSFLYNSYTTQNFLAISYDRALDLLFTTTVVGVSPGFHVGGRREGERGDRVGQPGKWLGRRASASSILGWTPKQRGRHDSLFHGGPAVFDDIWERSRAANLAGSKPLFLPFLQLPESSQTNHLVFFLRAYTRYGPSAVGYWKP